MNYETLQTQKIAQNAVFEEALFLESVALKGPNIVVTLPSTPLFFLAFL